MLAVEFKSTVDNGTIKIPQQYIQQIGKEVRVIVFTENRPTYEDKPRFSAISLHTRGYTISREESNER